MLFSDSYFTIASPGEGIYKDRGSKFLGFAFPVSSEAEIKTHLTALRKEHPSARHHCYAWRLGADKLAYRSNDDGEPSGTAGKPILTQIQSHDLTNILIVVVRYFGGTLLGVGGLVNAYKEAAVQAIKNSTITENFIYYEYSITFDFFQTGSVMKTLKDYDAKIISNVYEDKSVIIFRIKKQDSEKLENKIKELYTAGLKFLKMS
jgi:uncharacterized YigZ family protein